MYKDRLDRKEKLFGVRKVGVNAMINLMIEKDSVRWELEASEEDQTEKRKCKQVKRTRWKRRRRIISSRFMKLEINWRVV